MTTTSAPPPQAGERECVPRAGGADALERWLRRSVGLCAAAVVVGYVLLVLLADDLLQGHPHLSLGRAATVALVMLAGLGWILWRRPGAVTAFFTDEGHPVNLAVFRIVLFGLLLTSEHIAQARLFSTMPEVLQVPPLGWGPILSVLPIEPVLVDAVIVVFVLAAGMGLVGWCTRSAAAVTFITGVYVLGIPQFYGKVNHYHHLLWLVLLIAVSRAGDAWSVDSLRRRRRSGAEPVRRRDVAYALPLRFAMLLMGVMYFFPGFWKFVLSGPAWALSDNVKYQMYAKWAQIGEWTPLFPVDQHALLYRASGVFTLAFELGFVLLMLTPSGRAWAARAGVAFHVSVMLFMAIDFTALLALYVIFVDWPRVAGFMRGRFAPGAVRRWAGGSHAPVAVGGRPGTGSAFPLRALVVTGVALIAVNAVLGLARVGDGWPFAAYPTFAGTVGPEMTIVAIETTTTRGERRVLRPHQYGGALPSERLQGLLQVLLSEDAERQRTRLPALLAIMEPSLGDLEGLRSLAFYRETISVLPEARAGAPVARELLLEWEP